ncbi:MAG: FkbM family methyltransferase [Flavobacterium sp.]|nr:MAG: FkbM family methyltransferase [Flavobacterium sp.]
MVKSIFKKRRRQQGSFKRISWLKEKILKHQEDQQIKTARVNKFLVSYKRPYELLHTYREIFEREIYRFSSNKPSPVIIDCGANIGLSVLYYKELFPAAQVIAFEPDQSNFHLLERNVAQNHLNDVTLYQKAVWIADQIISFSANETEASHIVTDKNTGVTVPAIRFRDFLTRFDEIDFLKIDIEGAEWEVIRDCATSLSKVQKLFLEYHGKVHETEKLTHLLSIANDAGFSVYIKMAADHLAFPFVEKTLGLTYDVQLNLFCYKK